MNEESRLYHDTAARLTEAGWPVCVLDITTHSASEAAIMVAERIVQLHAAPPEQ